MQVTEQREYHAEEYAEAVTFVQEAAAEVADAVAWELHQAADEEYVQCPLALFPSVLPPLPLPLSQSPSNHP